MSTKFQFSNQWSNRPKFVSTPNSGISNVDASSYVPTVDLVDNLVRGGITLEANRRFQYQYPDSVPAEQITLERHALNRSDTITRESLIQARIAELVAKKQAYEDAIKAHEEAQKALESPPPAETKSASDS